VLQLVDAAGATADALNTVALLGTSATGTLTVGTNHTLTVNSLNLASGGTLTKDGSGTLVVSGTPATGNTGVLTVAVGTLTGTGTVAGPVSISSGATVSPGTSIPQGTTLTVGPTAFAAASTLRTTLFGTGSTEIGLLSSTGAVSVNSTAGIVLDLGAVNADSLRTAVGIGNSRTYTVAQGVGSVDNFTTSNLTLANQGSFQSSEWSILGSPSPGNVQLLFTPVPEPVTILGVGAILLGVARLRRRTGGVQ